VEIRVGIVGAGLITRNSHLPAVLGHPHARLTALVDSDTSRARALAESYGATPRVAPRVEDVLGEIDACIVATPNHTHAGLAVTCLRAGLHVLIEKPLATTVADGERIVRAAADSGTVAAVGYCTRFRDNIRLFTRLLAERRFGRATRFAYQYGTVGGWATLSAYTLDRAAAGGGVTVVSGTHFLDRLLYWFGAPDQVEYADDGHRGPEANAHCRFRFTGDAGPLHGAARFSKTAQLPGGMVVETEQGRLVLPETPGGAVRFLPRGCGDLALLVTDTVPSPDPPGSSDFQRQLHHFLLACRGEGVFPVTAEGGLESLKLLQRLYDARRPLAEPWRSVGVPVAEAAS
jgi:predicted dehydrogenase